MAILEDDYLKDLKYERDSIREALEEYPFSDLDDAIAQCLKNAHHAGDDAVHLPRDLMNELRTTMIKNAPALLIKNGVSPDALRLPDQITDVTVLKSAIDFIEAAGRFIRQEPPDCGNRLE